MNKYFLFFFAIIYLPISLYSQNVGINATGSSAHSSAGLDIDFTSKGLLIPRVALVSRASNSPVTSPATSLLVYNNATSGVSPNNVVPGYYYWDGSQWVALNGYGSKNWALLGNSGTIDGVDFIGTTDNVPFNIRVNNQKAGRIDNTLGNVFFGYLAGNAISIGTYNVSLGHSSLSNNSSGSYNIAIGYQAGDNITTGSNNLIIGSNIDAPSATANNQMSIGNLIYGTNVDGTGTSISSGNVGIGTASPTAKLHVYTDVINKKGFYIEPNSLLNGSLNNYTGAEIRANLDGASGNNYLLKLEHTNIGGGTPGSTNFILHTIGGYNSTVAYATIPATGGIVLGKNQNSNSTFTYGGIQAPLYVSNPIGTSGWSGYFGSGLGVWGGYIENTSTNNAIPDGSGIKGALYLTSTGALNNVVTTATNYGLHVTATGGDKNYAIYSASGINFFNDNVGIGTLSPAEKLEVCGNIKTIGNINASGTINASQAISCSSDKRFKKDITPIKNALSNILNMQGVTYNWRTDEFKNRGFNNKPQIGFIAQDIEKIYPELVQTDKDGYKSVDYSRLTVILVEALKEQENRIKRLEELVEQSKK